MKAAQSMATKLVPIMSDEMLFGIADEVGGDPRRQAQALSCLANFFAARAAHMVIEHQGDEVTMARLELIMREAEETNDHAGSGSELAKRAWRVRRFGDIEAMAMLGSCLQRNIDLWSGKEIPEPPSKGKRGRGFGNA